jgi:hypothetical protein
LKPPASSASCTPTECSRETDLPPRPPSRCGKGEHRHSQPPAPPFLRREGGPGGLGLPLPTHVAGGAAAAARDGPRVAAGARGAALQAERALAAAARQVDVAGQAAPAREPARGQAAVEAGCGGLQWGSGHLPCSPTDRHQSRSGSSPPDPPRHPPLGRLHLSTFVFFQKEKHWGRRGKPSHALLPPLPYAPHAGGRCEPRHRLTGNCSTSAALSARTFTA